MIYIHTYSSADYLKLTIKEVLFQIPHEVPYSVESSFLGASSLRRCGWISVKIITDLRVLSYVSL